MFALFAWRRLGSAARLLVAFLPLQFAFNLAPGLDLASSRVFALVLGAVWLIKKFSKIKILNTKYLILYTSFLLWAGLSLIGAPLVEPGLRKLAFLLSYLPLLIVLLDVQARAGERFKLIRAVATGGTLAAAAALFPLILAQFWGAADTADWWLNHITPIFSGAAVAGAVADFPSLFTAVGGADIFRAFGLFPDPHTLAFFLELTVPLTIAYAIVNRVSSIKYYVLSMLQLTVLLLTFSRGAYLGILAAAGVFGVLLLKDKLKFKNSTYLILNSKFLIPAALAILAGIILLTTFGARLTSLADRSAEARLVIWQEAAEVIKQHPVRGAGLGQLPFILEPAGDYRTPAYAHNLYLDIAAELGLVGLALWLALLWPAVYLLFKNFLASQITNYQLLITKLAAALSLLAFSTHAFFDTPLFSPQVLPMLLVILALTASAGNEKKAGFDA